MIYYVVVVVILVIGFYTGKPYLIGYIKNKRSKEKIKYVNSDLIYTPVSSSRTFYLAIEINEIGSGKVNFSVVKPKDFIE